MEYRRFCNETKGIRGLIASAKYWSDLIFKTDPNNIKTSTQTSDAIKQSSVNSQQLNVVAAITTQFLLKTTIEQTYFQQSGLSITPIAYLAHDIAQMTDLFGISSSAYGKQLATIIASALSVFSFASLGFSFFASASGLWELDQLEHAPMLMAYFATIVCAPVVINKIVDHFFGNSEYQSVKPWIKAISKSLVSFIPKVSTSAAGVLYQFPNKQRWTTLVKPFQQFKAEWQTLAFNETNPWQPIASHKARKLFTRLERSYNLTTNQILADNVLYADTDCFKTIDSNHFVGCTLSESSLVPNPFKSGAFPFWASTSLAEGGTGFLVTFQPPTTARFHFDAIFTIGGFNCSNTITSIAQCTKKPEYASEVRYNTYVLDRNPIHNGNITNLSGDDGLFRGLPYSGFITDPDGDEVIQSVSLARSGADVPQFWSVDARTGVNQGAYIYKHAGVWSAIQTGTSALDGTPGETYDRQVMVVDSKIHLPFTLSLPPGTIAVNRELTANHVAYSGQAFSLPTGELFATSDSSPITNIEFVTNSPAITYSRSRGVLEFDTTQDYRFYPNTSIPMMHSGYFLGTAESGETCRLFPLDCTPYPPATAITSNVSITELNSIPFFTRGFSSLIADIGETTQFTIQRSAISDPDPLDIAGLTCSFQMQDGSALLPGMSVSGCTMTWVIPRGTAIQTYNVDAYLHDSFGAVSAPEVLSFIVQGSGPSNVPGLPDQIATANINTPDCVQIGFPFRSRDLPLSSMAATLAPDVVATPSLPSMTATWNDTSSQYHVCWNMPDGTSGTIQRMVFSLDAVSYAPEIVVNNPGPHQAKSLSYKTAEAGNEWAASKAGLCGHEDAVLANSLTILFPSLPPGITYNQTHVYSDGPVRQLIQGTVPITAICRDNRGEELTVYGSMELPFSNPRIGALPNTTALIDLSSSEPEECVPLDVSSPDGSDLTLSLQSPSARNNRIVSFLGTTVCFNVAPDDNLGKYAPINAQAVTSAGKRASFQLNFTCPDRPLVVPTEFGMRTFAINKRGLFQPLLMASDPDGTAIFFDFSVPPELNGAELITPIFDRDPGSNTVGVTFPFRFQNAGPFVVDLTYWTAQQDPVHRTQTITWRNNAPQLEAAADQPFAFDQQAVINKPTCSDPLDGHLTEVTLSSDDIDVDTLCADSETSLTCNLRPGTYTLNAICSDFTTYLNATVRTPSLPASRSFQTIIAEETKDNTFIIIMGVMGGVVGATLIISTYLRQRSYTSSLKAARARLQHIAERFNEADGILKEKLLNQSHESRAASDLSSGASSRASLPPLPMSLRKVGRHRLAPLSIHRPDVFAGAGAGSAPVDEPAWLSGDHTEVEKKLNDLLAPLTQGILNKAYISNLRTMAPEINLETGNMTRLDKAPEIDTMRPSPLSEFVSLINTIKQAIDNARDDDESLPSYLGSSSGDESEATALFLPTLKPLERVKGSSRGLQKYSSQPLDEDAEKKAEACSAASTPKVKRTMSVMDPADHTTHSTPRNWHRRAPLDASPIQAPPPLHFVTVPQAHADRSSSPGHDSDTSSEAESFGAAMDAQVQSEVHIEREIDAWLRTEKVAWFKLLACCNAIRVSAIHNIGTTGSALTSTDLSHIKYWIITLKSLTQFGYRFHKEHANKLSLGHALEGAIHLLEILYPANSKEAVQFHLTNKNLISFRGAAIELTGTLLETIAFLKLEESIDLSERFKTHPSKTLNAIAIRIEQAIKKEGMTIYWDALHGFERYRAIISHFIFSKCSSRLERSVFRKPNHLAGSAHALDFAAELRRMAEILGSMASQSSSASCQNKCSVWWFGCFGRSAYRALDKEKSVVSTVAPSVVLAPCIVELTLNKKAVRQESPNEKRERHLQRQQIISGIIKSTTEPHKSAARLYLEVRRLIEYVIFELIDKNDDGSDREIDKLSKQLKTTNDVRAIVVAALRLYPQIIMEQNNDVLYGPQTERLLYGLWLVLLELKDPAYSKLQKVLNKIFGGFGEHTDDQVDSAYISHSFKQLEKLNCKHPETGRTIIKPLIDPRLWHEVVIASRDTLVIESEYGAGISNRVQPLQHQAFAPALASPRVTMPGFFQEAPTKSDSPVSPKANASSSPVHLKQHKVPTRQELGLKKLHTWRTDGQNSKGRKVQRYENIPIPTPAVCKSNTYSNRGRPAHAFATGAGIGAAVEAETKATLREHDLEAAHVFPAPMAMEP